MVFPDKQENNNNEQLDNIGKKFASFGGNLTDSINSTRSTRK